MNGENVSSAYGCLLRIRDKKERNPLFYRIPLQIKEAIDGTRTRDFHLGKVALYQLSHYRIRDLLSTFVIILQDISNVNIQF